MREKLIHVLRGCGYSAIRIGKVSDVTLPRSYKNILVKKLCIPITFDGPSLFIPLTVVDFLFCQKFLILVDEVFLDGEILLVWWLGLEN
jgi:hypothetical protein